MAIQTTTTLGGTPLGALDMVPVYIKKKLLPVLKKKLVFHQLGDAEDLPEGQGKTARWIRYERVGAPFIPLVEGVTPTTLRDQPVSKVEATVDQWGDIAGNTDVAELTVFHKFVPIIQERLATQSSEVIDREIQRVLLGGTNILFPDTAITDRTAIAAGNVINTDTIQRALANLRDYGAPDWEGGYFMGVFNPRVEQDIIKDPLFVTSALYGDQMPLMNGEVGRWMGVRWMRSNFIPSIVENTAVNAGSLTSPAASGAETALAGAAAYDLQITGLTFEGFETQIGGVQTVGSWAPGDVFEFILPALPSGVFAFNVYSAVTAGSRTLQAEAVGPGTYRLTGNGLSATAATGIQFSSSGRVAPIKPAAGVSVHQTYIFGRDAFGVLELDPIEVMITPNTPSDSDPLKQRRKYGWKTLFKAVIKNSNFYYRVESSSRF